MTPPPPPPPPLLPARPQITQGSSKYDLVINCHLVSSMNLPCMHVCTILWSKIHDVGITPHSISGQQLAAEVQHAACSKCRGSHPRCSDILSAGNLCSLITFHASADDRPQVKRVLEPEQFRCVLNSSTGLSFTDGAFISYRVESSDCAFISSHAAITLILVAPAGNSQRTSRN